MANTLQLQEPAVDALIAAGWVGLRLERGVDATNIGSFQLLAQVPYVAHQLNYTYVDTTGAVSDWYRSARYGPGGVGTFSPPWPVVIPPTTTAPPARRSLRNMRRMLGRRLQGSVHVVTTTADGTLAGTSLISLSGLANQMDPNRFRQWWIMPTDGVSAGQVRHVGEQGLNPSSGELSIQPAFTTQIVRGTQVELHRLLPPTEMDGFIGLKECLNLALAECWALDRLQLTGLDNTVTYDLQFGDWMDPQAVNEFYGPSQGRGWLDAPWGGWDSRRDGSSILLDTAPGFGAADTMSVQLTRPADTMIKRAGVWCDNQQGFVDDDDECLLQPEFLVQVALAHAYDVLAGVSTGAAAARWAVKADNQRAVANKAKYVGLPHPPERANHPAGGGGFYGSGPWWSWLK